MFSGSENVIENLLKSDLLNDQYSLIFYYAYSNEYEKGVIKRFAGYSNIRSIKILSAFNKWGYRAKLEGQKRGLKSSYLFFRYFVSRLFQAVGVYDLYNFYKLYALFLKENPNLLYINNGGYPAARSCRIAVISAGLAGIHNIIFNVNNLALPQRSIIEKWFDKYINKRVSYFVTASKAAGKQLVTERNFDGSKCINIPNTLLKTTESQAKIINGVLKEDFQIKEGEIILGAAGLLTNRKGFHILIEAVKLLKTKNTPSFKLLIFGEGEQRSFLEKKIKEYGLESNIMLPGYRNSIRSYMKEFDVFICPSVADEDFPYVIIEAMSLSKPIIGTRIAGIPEQIINGYNGFVVPHSDVGALATSIEHLLSDKGLIKIMGANSYTRYNENFSNDIVINSYRKLFEHLLIKRSEKSINEIVS